MDEWPMSLAGAIKNVRDAVATVGNHPMIRRAGGVEVARWGETGSKSVNRKKRSTRLSAGDRPGDAISGGVHLEYTTNRHICHAGIIYFITCILAILRIFVVFPAGVQSWNE